MHREKREYKAWNTFDDDDDTFCVSHSSPSKHQHAAPRFALCLCAYIDSLRFKVDDEMVNWVAQITRRKKIVK